MSKFRKEGKKAAPAISTASLPDIVFMLLFFFMVTTVMREVSLKVKISQPKATEISKLQRKSLVAYIYIGPPTKQYSVTLGSLPRIQLDDSFARVDQIPEWVAKVKSETNEAEIPLLTYSLKVDKDTKMGIVTEVKQELRKAEALKINYSTLKGSDVKRR
jgi:biopolymer transport protein ExbD